MQTFIGTKTIQAAPAERGGQPGYDVTYADGYESWSPKEAFEEAYRPTDRLDIGRALHAMREGHIITRTAWQGSARVVCINGGVPILHCTSGTDIYSPSPADMLADDWQAMG